MILVYLGVLAAALAVLFLPVVAIFGMGRRHKPLEDDPFEVTPTQRRMPYDSGSVDYRRS